MRVVASLEFRGRSAIRGPLADARRTISVASSATVPACLDLTRGGPAQWPAREFVRPGRAQKYVKLSRRRPAGLLKNMKPVFPEARGSYEQGIDTRTISINP